MIYKQKMIWRELAILLNGVVSSQSGLSIDMGRVDPQYKEPKLAELTWVKAINNAASKIFGSSNLAPHPVITKSTSVAPPANVETSSMSQPQEKEEKTVDLPFDEKMRPVPIFRVEPEKINTKSFFGSLNWKRNDANTPLATGVGDEIVNQESAVAFAEEHSEAGQFFQKAIPWGGKTKDPVEMQSLRKGVEFVSYKNMMEVATMTAIQKSQSKRKQSSRFEGEGNGKSAKNFLHKFNMEKELILMSNETKPSSPRLHPALREMIRKAEARHFTDDELSAIEKEYPEYKNRVEAIKEIRQKDVAIITSLVKEVYMQYEYDKYHDYASAKCPRDVRYIVQYAAHAMIFGEPQWFDDKLLIWLKTILQAFDFPDRKPQPASTLFSDPVLEEKLKMLPVKTKSIFHIYYRLDQEMKKQLAPANYDLIGSYLKQATNTLTEKY